MKTLLIAPFLLAAASSAWSQTADVPASRLSTMDLRLQTGDRAATPLRLDETTALAFVAPTPDGKKGQVWVGLPSLSYEYFSSDKGGEEFGFSPTSYFGYQHNFYPDGRMRNGVGYSLGIGAAALGGAIFYHQGAGKGVDFRAGVAVDLVYYNNFSYFGDSSHFIVLPFVAWGIKV